MKEFAVCSTFRDSLVKRIIKALVFRPTNRTQSAVMAMNEWKWACVMFSYSRFSVTTMLGQQYVLLLLCFLFSVRGDESAELFESAVKNICDSSNVGNVNEACLQKLVNSYFGRFSWCQSTKASCFVCSTSNLVRLACKLMCLLIMVPCTVFSAFFMLLFHR